MTVIKKMCPTFIRARSLRDGFIFEATSLPKLCAALKINSMFNLNSRLNSTFHYKKVHLFSLIFDHSCSDHDISTPEVFEGNVTLFSQEDVYTLTKRLYSDIWRFANRTISCVPWLQIFQYP